MKMPILFLALGLILLASACYLYFNQEQSPDPDFILETNNITRNDLDPGEHELSIKITNSADRPRRIIGLAEG